MDFYIKKEPADTPIIKSEFPEGSCSDIIKEEIAIEADNQDSKANIKNEPEEISIKTEPLITEELDIDEFKTVPEPEQQSTFVCSICGYQALAVNKLRYHLITHSNKKFHSCNVCDYKCYKRYRLVAHMATHTDKIPIKRLKIHKKSKLRNVKCKYCEFESLSGYLSQHMIAEHGDKCFACTQCSYKTLHKRNLENHQSWHEKGTFFKCSKCNYGTRVKSNFEMHIPTHNKTPQKNDFDKHKVRLTRPKPPTRMNSQLNSLFKCSKCSYRTKVKKNFDMHIPIHNKTPQRNNLDKHKISCENETFFKCSKCDYRTNVKKSFEMHIPTHATLPPSLWRCTEAHYNSHEKCFTCNVCKVELSAENDMKMHIILTHFMQKTKQANKVFKCSKCKMELSEYDMKEHKCMQNTIQPRNFYFKCSKCDYRTTVERNFRMHVPTHTDIVKPVQIAPANTLPTADPYVINQGFFIVNSQQVADCYYQTQNPVNYTI